MTGFVSGIVLYFFWAWVANKWTLLADARFSNGKK
jgi:hypothetical protein